jgi:hypothetical protein
MSVGALTSMPYAFSTRPWELRSTDSIDVLDAMASSVKIDVVNNLVVRILPRLDEGLNEEWISNKARYVYDGLDKNRLCYPKFRFFSKLVIISWFKAINIFLNFLFFFKFDLINVVSGFFMDLEGSCSLKDFFNGIGCSTLMCFERIVYSDFRYSYLLGVSISSFEVASFVFLFFSNLRFEYPLLNSRLRKNFLYNLENSSFFVFCFGFFNDYLTFPVKSFGNSLKCVVDFFYGKLRFFIDLFLNKFIGFSFFDLSFKYFFKPLVLVGSSIYSKVDFFSYFFYIIDFFKFAFPIKSNWVWLGFLPLSLGKISAQEVFFGGNFKRNALISFNYLCGCDSFNFLNNNNGFVVYQGFFKNNSFFFNNLNLIFPVSIYVEQVSTYLNMEGRFRTTRQVVSSFIHSDWEVVQILNFFSKSIASSSISFFFNVLFDLNFFFYNFVNYNCVFFNSKMFLNRLFLVSAFKSCEILCNVSLIIPFFYVYNFFFFKFVNTIFFRLVNNYYDVDSYSKNSKILSLNSLKTFSRSFFV